MLSRTRKCRSLKAIQYNNLFTTIEEIGFDVTHASRIGGFTKGDVPNSRWQSWGLPRNGIEACHLPSRGLTLSSFILLA